MRFGPEFLIAVFVEERNLLDGGPAKNGVVADERSDVAVGDSVTNSRID